MKIYGENFEAVRNPKKFYHLLCASKVFGCEPKEYRGKGRRSRIVTENFEKKNQISLGLSGLGHGKTWIAQKSSFLNNSDPLNAKI